MITVLAKATEREAHPKKGAKKERKKSLIRIKNIQIKVFLCAHYNFPFFTYYSRGREKHETKLTS